MEIRHLRYFAMVARERSFTRAAAQLNIAQPPLSRQIQQFEAELGLLLINRKIRPLQLTEAGRLIYEQTAQILERVEDMHALAHRLQNAQPNVFRIGFVASMLYGKLPDVIRVYRADHPETELVLSELMSIDQIAALKEGRIDVGFGRIPLDDPAVTRVLLHNEPLIVALPPDHRLARLDTAPTLRDLATEELIVYPRAPRPSYADQILSYFRNRNLRPRRVQEVRELQTALGLVAAGLGTCLVPASVDRFRRDNVVYRSLDEDDVISPIFMSILKGNSSPEVVDILRIAGEAYHREA